MKPHLHALRALQDCGVVRASAVAAGFKTLALLGWATGGEVPGHSELADWKMTPSGAAAAERELAGGGGLTCAR